MEGQTSRASKLPDMEGSIRELMELAPNKPWKGPVKKRGEQLLKFLRRNGFTSRDIQDVTGGAVTEPTAKAYTRGTRVEDPAPKELTLSLVADLLTRGRSLEDLDKFVGFLKHIESSGLSQDGFVSFLAEGKAEGLSEKDLAGLIKKLKEANLSAGDLKTALSIRSDMERWGIGPETLSGIVDVVKKFEDPDEALRGLLSYANVEAIKSELKTLSSQKSKSEEQLKSSLERAKEARDELTELERKRAEVKGSLESHDRLRKAGFTLEALEMIEALSKRHGGPRQVLFALREYSNVEDLKGKRANIESELKKVQAEHVHLITVVNICDELIYKRGFTPESIIKIYEVASKYGKPNDVMNALGSFKDLDGISTQKEEARKELEGFEARKKELQTEVQTLTVRFDQLNESIGKIVGSIVEKYDGIIASISSTYEEHLKRWRQLEVEAGKLEEELGLARIFNAIFKYPLETKELPLEIVLRLIQAVKNICAIKGVNPQVQAGEEIHSRSLTINLYATVPLLDIIDWAYRGLLGEILKQKS